jgi:hypothetical protein
MNKPRLATSKTTAPKKKKKLNKSGVPRKWSDAWWAEYWNAEYEMLLHNLKNLDRYLLAAETYIINGKTEKVVESIQGARELYLWNINRPTIESLTVVEDTQSLNLGTDGLDRGKAQTGARRSE